MISNTYHYDAEGKVLDDYGDVTYTYDALDQRVSVAAAPGTTEYVYDIFGHRISSWQASTNIGTEGRIYWGDRQIAFRALDGQTYFEHQDWLGTERERSNYQGQPASTHFSMAFGEGSSVSVAYGSAGQDNAQYTGLEFDAVTNTNHAQFRQYSPTQGRWMSPDPYDGSMDLGTRRASTGMAMCSTTQWHGQTQRA